MEDLVYKLLCPFLYINKILPERRIFLESIGREYNRSIQPLIQVYTVRRHPH